MKILHLTLKKKWFDMIASGKKKEEYREIKPYWNKRLNNRHYDVICFRNGYGKSVPQIMVEYLGLKSYLGNIEWGAPQGQTVHIIKLGRILESSNIESQ